MDRFAASGSAFNVTPSYSPPDSNGELEFSQTTSSLSDAPSSRSPAGDDGLINNLLGADSDDNDWMSSDLSTSPAGHNPLPAYAAGPYPMSPAASDSVQLGAPLESHSFRAIDEDYDMAPASVSASSNTGGDAEADFVMIENDRSEASPEAKSGEKAAPTVAQPE